MSNYFANIESSDGQRDVNDQYETPHSITEALCNHVVFHPTVFEPACGTGRVVRALAAEGYAVTAKDIQTGNDFLEVLKWHGSIVTNPPYHKGLAEAFIRHALSLTDQPCAFLVRTGFLNSQRRCRLFHEHPPTTVLYVSPRIKFFKADGTRISGQAHDHCWVVWNEPERRSPIWLTPEECYDASLDRGPIT